MPTKKTILVTGGAGFIGVNAAEAFIQDGWHVILLDNLSRKGTDLNLQYLLGRYAGECEFVHADVRSDPYRLLRAVESCEVVLHLAAQVAVTTSVVNPREDFDINARGTFNVLEAVREAGNRPLFIYSSTNKVYGGLEDVVVEEGATAYRFRDLPLGLPEERLLDFHSPYGCSKGAADQYVRDYSRIYGIPTVVFRQSCIYGPRQFGVEDQGWVAWFAIAALLGKPITVYGNGKQVRDLLHVGDLVAAYKCAVACPAKASGKVFNVGGGPNYTLSVLDLLGFLKVHLNKEILFDFSDWRPGDQPVFVSDIRRIEKDLGWTPAVAPIKGVETLVSWIRENQCLLERLFGTV